MANKNLKIKFFKKDTEHGRVKRIMYKKYVQAYLEKTQSEKFSLRSILIDGFAGSGRYGNEWPNEIDKYGSPLISLIVSLDFYCKKDMEEKKKNNSQKESGEAARREENVDDMDKTVTEAKEPDTPVLKNDTKNCFLLGWRASELTPEEELSREVKTDDRRKPYCDMKTKISLIFIESDHGIFKELTQNVELLIIKFLRDNYPSHYYKYSSAKEEVKFLLDTAPFSISVKIINKEFKETNPPVALYDEDVRSLTFLDPFGFTQTPLNHVKMFALCPGNEVFINFMSCAVNRFVSQCTEGVLDLYGMSDQLEDVARSLGIDQPDLKDTAGLADFIKCVIHSAQSHNKIECNKINSCTAIYESFFKKKTNSKYSLVFEVKDKRNLTIYHMVHITNHIRGVEAMKESMNRCSQREGEMVMSAYDIVQKGHVLNLCNLDDPVKVAKQIYEHFRGYLREVPLEEIKEYVLVDTEYLFRKTPLKILKDKGLIRDVFKNGERQKTTNRFPDTDKETKKPIFWSFSFSDENFNVTEIKSNKNVLEKQNESVKPSEKRKMCESNKREQKMSKTENERARRKEERERKDQEKIKRQAAKHLEKQRKTEERRKQKEEEKKKREEGKLEKQRKKELQRKGMISQKSITDFFTDVNNEKDKWSAANHSIGSFCDAGCDKENTAPLIGELKGEKGDKKA